MGSLRKRNFEIANAHIGLIIQPMGIFQQVTYFALDSYLYHYNLLWYIF